MGNQQSGAGGTGGGKDKGEKGQKKYEPPVPTRVGKKCKPVKGADATNKLPGITPHTKCRLHLLKQERIKDYLLMEEEFVRNQERLKPQEEKNEEERSKVDDLRGTPMPVGSLEEIIDDNHAIVSTSQPSNMETDPPTAGSTTSNDSNIDTAAPLVYPKEPFKTLLSVVIFVVALVAMSASLAFTHDLVPDMDPLPDIVLDNVRYQQWGLFASDVLVILTIIMAALVVVSHSHRWIVLRRILLMVGMLYCYRAITISAKKLLTQSMIAERILQIISGGGLSINSKEGYCGDFIFSGHTVVFTMGYYAIRDYSSRGFFLLHRLSLCTSGAGVILLLLARGHYSIDVVIAYWVSSRLWWQYHTLAHNKDLQRRGNHNFLSEIWWFPIFLFFETNVPGPLPREYNLPIPDFVREYVQQQFSRLCLRI